jgi:SAM-dependent methyltransferase
LRLRHRRKENHLSKEPAALQSEYFDQVQYRGAFDPVVSAYAEPKVEFIRRYAPIEGNILDVGCGNGIFTARFAAAGASVVGIDFSHHLLHQNPHRPLICGDAAVLPFADSTFDTVFEANLLHHVPARERVISEMKRVSRKYVVLLEPNRYNPLMLAFSLLVRAERGGLRSSAKSLERDLRACGLRVVSSLTTGMISQNNTPTMLIPLLRRFDRQIWWGEYVVIVAEKVG